MSSVSRGCTRWTGRARTGFLAHRVDEQTAELHRLEGRFRSGRRVGVGQVGPVCVGIDLDLCGGDIAHVHHDRVGYYMESTDY